MGNFFFVFSGFKMSGKTIIIDGCDHLCFSGATHRAQRKAMQFRRKKVITNPKKGPFHHRAPSRCFHRVVRGMVPHKTTRGTNAMNNLKVYDGCPPPYDTKKKMVVPQALRTLRLKPGNAYCSLGEVQSRVGWQYGEVVARLEEARKVKAYKWHLQNKVATADRRKAIKAANNDAKVKPFSALLQQNGY